MNTTSDIFEAPAQDLFEVIKSLLGEGILATAITVVLIVLATAVIAHLATRFLRHLLSHDNSPLPSSTIFINISRVVLWGIGLSIIFSTCFGIDVTAAVAALGIGGIALSLGFQDTISNLIGGLQISILGIVEPGDNIEMAGARGVVSDVTWRNVTVDIATGGQVIVPNSVINKGAFTKLPPAEKVVISVNFDKAVTDLDGMANRMEKVISDALEGVVTVEKAPAIMFDSITEFGYAGSVVVWIDSRQDQLVVKDVVVRALAPFTKELQ